MPTVLVVDNDTAHLSATERTLSAAGYKVEMATSARAALRVLAAADIDLVLLEVILPEMEGIEAILEMQRHWPHRPVIAMTAGGAVITADYALQLAKAVGARSTLSKPFSGAELLIALNGALTSAAA